MDTERDMRARFNIKFTNMLNIYLDIYKLEKINNFVYKNVEISILPVRVIL